jgi:hypothetical protein
VSEPTTTDVNSDKLAIAAKEITAHRKETLDVPNGLN